MRQMLVLRWTIALFLAVFNVERCDCFKALFVFPFPAKSHFTTFVVLAEELARRGHEVTVLSAFSKEKPNYRQIVIDSKPFERSATALNATEFRQMNQFVAASFTWNYFLDMLEIGLQSKELQSVINSNEHYDVILGQVSFFQPVLVGLSHKFNAPFIDLSPSAPFMFAASILGNPHDFSYVPNPLLPLGDRMTYFERVYNFYLSLWQIAGEYLYLLPALDALMRKYFTYPGAESLPKLREMMRNVSLSLVNAHFSINYPRPYAPNMVEVGGFHLKPINKLPQDLQKFMDDAKHGVVYLSFGTVVQGDMLSAERIQTIASALKRLKQHVILRWDDPVPFKNAQNILVLSFTPQQEILAHPNCVLFVTHGGYNSLVEVTRAGVPVLGMPFFADQFRNIRYYEESGVGKGLDLDRFTSDELHDTITTIINTPSFREKAKEIARRMQDRPQNALDTAIFWIEYVVRHKGAHHLKPAAVYIPYCHYLYLDVLGSTLIVVFLVIFIVRKLIHKLCSSEDKSKAFRGLDSEKKIN